ncbi:hypothetical protein RHA1_ro10452 (plasmid) [Rhodococcus jostii RHA1]|uniref:Uncharacterized protein n=1 Tax=Rhodococcus jostii (strain RHA1) TaxID=101510 RepID=Q0RVP5_RHOJR|nr:hypothetical protein RHA1_ro10452 [Rhodococcus jostii RHA1]
MGAGRGKEQWQKAAGEARRAATEKRLLREVEPILRRWCDEQRPLTQWTRQAVVNASRDGSGPPRIPKPTLYRYFTTNDALWDRVATEITRRGDEEVPSLIRAAATGNLDSRQPAWVFEFVTSSDNLELLTFSGSAAKVKLAQSRYSEVRKTGDTLTRIVAATVLARALLSSALTDLRLTATQADQTKRKRTIADARASLSEAVVNCEDALSLVRKGNHTHLRVALKCLKIASEAERLLSRQSGNGIHLRKLAIFKRTEVEYAEELGWRTRAAIAKFHQNRAEALRDQDRELEWESITSAAHEFVTLCDEGEVIEAGDVTMIFSRYFAARVAYDLIPTDEQSRTFRKLQNLYPRTRMGTKSRANVTTLEKVVKFSNAYDRLSAPDSDPSEVTNLLKEYDFTATSLTRANRFPGVGHLLLARYSTALWFSAKENGGQWPRALGAFDLVQAEPLDFLRRSLKFYDDAQFEKRDEGAAGRIKQIAAVEGKRMRAEFERALTERGIHPESIGMEQMSSEEINKVIESINQLVFNAARFEIRSTDSMRILVAIEPIQDYLMAIQPV